MNNLTLNKQDLSKELVQGMVEKGKSTAKCAALKHGGGLAFRNVIGQHITMR